MTLGTAAGAAAQTSGRSPFTGLYAGVDAGTVNVIGGALVDGVDTLAQDTRPAITVFGGGRYAFAGRFVLGAEVGFGFEDGDLQLEDPSRGLVVDYRNSRHVRLGGTAGVAFGQGRRTLVFAYVSELSRSFDVTITSPADVVTQQDDQGLLRYGGGIEQALGRWFSLRGTLGSSRADFGGRDTNIEVTRPLEFSVGVTVRF